MAVVRYFECALLRLRVAALHHSARATLVPATEAMMSAEATAFPAAFMFAKPRQHGKAMLLAIIEALVERTGSVGELLEAGRALTHRVRTQGQALDRILGAIGAGARGKSFRSLLSEIAQRGLHGRPVFFLFGGKL